MGETNKLLIEKTDELIELTKHQLFEAENLLMNIYYWLSQCDINSKTIEKKLDQISEYLQKD